MNSTNKHKTYDKTKHYAECGAVSGFMVATITL